jgi:hypothetical protein
MIARLHQDRTCKITFVLKSFCAEFFHYRVKSLEVDHFGLKTLEVDPFGLKTVEVDHF